MGAKKETFVITFGEEQANFLQRLGVEVDSKIFLIDRMFANHANDDNDSLFNSVAFQHYHQEYEEAYAAWELAKKEFESTYLKPIVKEKTGKDDITFNWEINDFPSCECHITILDD